MGRPGWNGKGWHCQRDAYPWPGCGACPGCRDAAPTVYAAARRQAQLISELTDGLMGLSTRLTELALHRDEQAELLHDGWAVIANSGAFDNGPTEGCHDAAVAWRDRWHACLSEHGALQPEEWLG